MSGEQSAIQQSLPGCSPISPFSEQGPSTQKLQQAPTHPSKSGSGNPGREEVKLASNRGRKAASHAHCTGWHQEIKLPRHGLQQRSTPGKAGGTDGQCVNWGGWVSGTTEGWGQHSREHGEELTQFMWVRPG